jgi:hypothetical protein
MQAAGRAFAAGLVRAARDGRYSRRAYAQIHMPGDMLCSPYNYGIGEGAFLRCLVEIGGAY